MARPVPYFIEFRGDSPSFFVEGKIHRDPKALVLQDGLLTDDWLFQKMFIQHTPKQTVSSKLLGQKIIPFLSIPLFAHPAMKSTLFKATEQIGAKESFMIFSATAYCTGDESLKGQRIGLIDIGQYKTSLTLVEKQIINAGVSTCRVLNLGANHLKKYSEHGNFKAIFANALLTEALLAFGAGLPVRIIGESLDLELLGPLHDNFSITVDSDFLEKIFAGLQHIAGNMSKDIQDKFTRIEEGSKDALEWERMIRGES